MKEDNEQTVTEELIIRSAGYLRLPSAVKRTHPNILDGKDPIASIKEEKDFIALTYRFSKVN